MDICSYVNSKDIREFLRKIEYEFNSLEAAWLVYQCNDLPFEDKKKAWIEIVDTMPDCEVPKRFNCKGWESLHSFLEQYIEVIEKYIRRFLEDVAGDRNVYRFSYLYKDDHSWTEEFNTVFPSLETCLKALKADIADLDESFSKDGTTGVMRYIIKKQSLVNTDKYAEVEYNSRDQLLQIIGYPYDDEDIDFVSQSFEGLWFAFPTPFEKGDVVWVPQRETMIHWECDGGFVLDDISAWDGHTHIAENGDNSDMNGCGFFVNENGTIYHEVMFNYMDLEFYKGPYKMNERILPVLSKYIKGEIPVDMLMCAYRKVLLDLAADDIMLKGWYDCYDLKGMGLLN